MRVLRVALLPLLAVSLTGCDGGSAPVLASPTSTPPIFTSPPWTEDEALTLATTVFERYLEISNQIYNEGGIEPERIDVATSATIAIEEHEGFDEVRRSGHSFSGQMRLTHTRLQQIHSSATKSAPGVTAYMCVDLRGTDVRDSTGASVISAARPNTRTWEVSVGHGTAANHDEFIITDKSVWKESSECE